MWLMLQQDVPDDYVIATGRSLTVREMVDIAFRCAGLEAAAFVRSHEHLMRPADVKYLRGDASRARAKLGWMPTITLEDMLAEMVEADIARHRARMAR
jgi:GDPmannose 4,6-dehydratase